MNSLLFFFWSGEESPPESHVFKFEEIAQATSYFDTELGVAGYGRVYLGQLRDGRRVAVKLLRYGQFFDEVAVLSRICHENLVAIYGCTYSGHRDLLLVYEYVPNGTVEDYIHGRRRGLTMALRIQIAIQTAEALVYLHSLEPPIIHGDVKTANILLDDDFCVKVADWGLCRLLSRGIRHVSTTPRGTMGYRDPEYDLNCTLTDKSDVYSFGVVLLGLISGKANVDITRDPYNTYLVDLALNLIENKVLDELVDPELGYHSDGDVTRMINSVAELASRCLQAKRRLRPAMSDVLNVLKGIKHGKQDIRSNDKGLTDKVVEWTVKTSKLMTGKGKGSKETDTKGIKEGKQPIPVEYEGLEDIDTQEKKLNKQQTHVKHEDNDAEGIKLADDDGKGIEEVDDISEVRVFSYEELKKATNNFDTARELVNGGSRRVYLGNLQDGQIVAVKVLIDPNSRWLDQFFVDVVILSRIRHENLVALYGCTEPHNQALLLVYEFVPNGSIADHLHGQRPTLTWDVRIEIALETAQALAYLHTHEPPIIYHGLNTSNILVDNAFHAKLANLSESRLLPLDIKQTSTVPETVGYQNPENNVYSFGMVLVELISGKFVEDITLKSTSNKELEILVDPKLGCNFSHKFRTTVNSIIELAARCLNQTGTMRPSMLEVVTELKQLKDGFKQKLAEDKRLNEEEEEEEANVLGLFTHEELCHATNSWDLLREISYGSGLDKVYLGKFRDIRAIAVKVVKDRNLEQQKEMINEVKVVSRRTHKNLLTFYGYSSPLRNQDMLLVYEYVNFNGTVADYIQGTRPSLTWDSRIHIAAETAEALAHLHFGCQKRIIHGYVKTSNILLDSGFHVKVSCLGKYDLLTTPEDMDGYREPDCNETGMLTEMSDVYSFGLVLVELISGKQAVEVFQGIGESYLVGDELNKIIKEGLKVIVDPFLEYDTNSEVSRRIKSLAELACRCLNKDARPSMRDVLTGLKEIKGADFASNLIKGEVFTYEELREATNSFDASREVGRDFFDRTYLGKLRDKRKVAVKLLAHRALEVLESLFEEVKEFSSPRHENLATLYGCTAPRIGEMFLVHEYVPNNTLEYYLHKNHNKRGAFITSILHSFGIQKRKKGALDWSLRIRIAIETAEALSHLHSQKPPIIHGSLTTYNILLDESFHVKVSGVNLFIRRSLEEAGHFCKDGYDDPMYEFKDLPTEKVDVFSFGVVLFELISGLQAVDSNRDRTSVYLYNMGLSKMLNQQMDEFVDIRLDYHSDADTKRMIDSVAELARMCLDMKQNMRPTMREVLSALKEIKRQSNLASGSAHGSS